MSHVFISYSRRDTAVVDSIAGRLEKAGIDVWIDREDIEAGRQWRAQIVEAIDTAEAFVLNVSEHSIASINVLKELNLAEGVPDPFVLPVLLQDIKLPAEMRYQLAGVQQILYYIDPEEAYRDLETTLKERHEQVVQKDSKPAASREIEIVVKGETVADFDEAKKQQLLELLAEATGTSLSQLAVTRIELGSLHVFVGAPRQTGYALKALALNGDERLVRAGIERLRFTGDANFIPLDEGAPPPTTLKERLVRGFKQLPRPILWTLFGTFLLLAVLVGYLLPPGTTLIPTARPVLSGDEGPTASLTDTPTPTAEYTATATNIPTPSATPTETLTPTPVRTSIKFWAEPEEIKAGACTTIHWHVENAQRVIFKNREQPFDGSYSECLCEKQNYSLTVFHLDGTEEKRKVSVAVRGSCVTPTDTPKPEDKTPPPAPRQVAPKNNEVLPCFGSTPTLQWHAPKDDSGIAEYYVKVQNDYSNNDWDSVQNIGYTTQNTSIVIHKVCANYYRWQVLAVDNAGNTGPWSGWSYFTISLD
jgi:hypothetical protein